MELLNTSPAVKTAFFGQRNKLIQLLLGGLLSLPDGFTGDPVVLLWLAFIVVFDISGILKPTTHVEVWVLSFIA